MRENWTKEKVLEDAKKYTRAGDWHKNSSAAFRAAYRLKIYKEATAHMPRAKKTWTNEEIIADAKLYSTKIEWRKNSEVKYQLACRRNIIDTACKHMKPQGDRFKRQIYAIENEDRSVYVGLSYNPERRYKQHIKYDARHPCSKILHKHYTYGTQKLKIFETFYSLEEIQKKEAEYIEKYQSDGWIILNTAKAGGLGISNPKYTREYCAKLAKDCIDKKDFILKHKIIYTMICSRGWLDVISHLSNRKRHPYTEEEIQAVALQCKTRAEFHRRFPVIYSVAYQRGILEKVTQHLPGKYKKKRTFKKK